MPPRPEWMASDRLLTASEVLRLAGIFVKSYGISKIRFTGGEPLVRPDATGIIESVARLGVETAVTTNGILLHHFLPLFREIGLSGLNVSLDTLNPQKFTRLTLRNAFTQVWDNILRALDRGFHVKLNMVVMRGWNEDELVDFVGLTRNLPLHVRFIEYMPFRGNGWNSGSVFTYREMLESIGREYPVEKIEDPKYSTSKSYRVPGFAGTFGVISTVSQPFCGTCNRIRLTADGTLRNCLFTRDEINLREALRKGEPVEPLIEKAVLLKHRQHGGLPGFGEQAVTTTLSARSMAAIGG